MSSPLERYRSILRGRAHARYLLAKSVEADASDGLTLTEMWEIHDSKLVEYRGLVDANAAPRPVEGSLLDLKVRISEEMLKECSLCEHDCRVDRRGATRGWCQVLTPRIASHFTHLGEEEPLVPSYTVFFAGCNMRCVYCQNCDISFSPECGLEVPAEELAPVIEGRAVASGLRNVNWVGGDPTPNIPYVLSVLGHVGANIPQVWNSNMYLSEEGMSLLDGAMDVYLTDFKYGNDACAARLSGVKDYMRIVTRNHLLAASQGEVMVRHLMLPGHYKCCTLPVLDWLADHLPGALVNVMAQYHPEHRARDFPELRGRVTAREHRAALEHARQKGLLLV